MSLGRDVSYLSPLAILSSSFGRCVSGFWFMWCLCLSNFLIAGCGGDFSPLCILVPPSKISWPWMSGFAPGVCVLCHCPAGLSLCQDLLVLSTVALQCPAESGRVLPPALFLVLRNALAILRQEWFQVNFRNSGSSFVKMSQGIY